MRVTILSPRLGEASGVGRHVQLLSEKLSERGHKVSVISTKNTYYIPVKNFKNFSWSIAASLRRTENDIVHAHNLPSILPAKITARKRVLTLHGYYSAQIRLLHGNILGKVSTVLEKQAIQWADILTCVSKRTTELYREIGFNAKYVPNAVDYLKIKSLCKGVKRSRKRIVYVGRKSREKGYDIFQKLIKKLCSSIYEYEFLTVFDKPWDETIKILASATMLILPSRLEGLPTIILESFACGTPVLASKIGGVDELIEDYKTGLTFKTEDVKDLTNQLQIIINDESLWRTLSKNGEIKVKTDYDWDNVVKQYEQIYLSLLEKE